MANLKAEDRDPGRKLRMQAGELKTEGEDCRQVDSRLRAEIAAMLTSLSKVAADGA